MNTRLRLTHNNQWVTHAPSFELLIARRIGRVKNLSDLYGETNLISSAEKQELVEQAKPIRIHTQNMEWTEWSCYLGHQKEWMKFDTRVAPSPASATSNPKMETRPTAQK